MSKPRRQHFIPKSYLRNFADIEGDKAFVEVMNVNTDEIKYPFSINNVCVSKNIYTLPHVEEKDKYFVEHFYAQNIDAVYPEAYSLLTNHKAINISEEQRSKILHTSLSLYFRNARFLEGKNEEMDFLIDRIRQKAEGCPESQFTMRFGGKLYNFKGGEIDQVREQIIVDNRINFILSHLQEWQNFVSFKNNSQITVSKIVGEVRLITSDNPVRISNHKREQFDLLDPDNSIQLPLDQDHLLWISPNDEETNRHQIYRGLRDKWFAITSNHTMQQDASEWIIGRKGSIKRYLQEDSRYNTFDPENVKALEDIQIRVIEMNKFIEFAKANGGMTTAPSLQKLRELKQMPAIASDPQFQLLCLELKINGFEV